MIISGVVGEDNTIKVDGLLTLQVGQRVSLAIFPYEEDDSGACNASLQPRSLSSNEIDELERITKKRKPRIAKPVRGGSPADISRVMRSLPSVPPEDVGALERAISEGRDISGEGAYT